MRMSRTRILIAAAGAAAVAAVAFGVWYVALRGDAPPPASLEGAVGSVAEATATPTAASTPAPAAEATPAGGDASTPAPAPTAAAGDGGLTGRWVISEQGETFAGYRVKEELTTIGAFTAVGRTAAVTGSLAFDGEAITSVGIEADLTLLESDDSRRDRALGRQALETSAYPTATFSLTEPIALGGVPAEGEEIEAQATGELTIHGVTREVTLALDGVLRGGLVFVAGSTEIVFADYGIEQPRSLIVLSVEDRGVMEFQLVFERAP